MGSKSWIRLWMDFLDDDKMGILPEHLQLRFMKLCLLAGYYDDNGLLPSDERIAWRLRLGLDETRKTLHELQQVGLIQFVDNRFVVVNYNKRQAPMSGAERVRRHRERKARNDHVTDCYTKRNDAGVTSSVSVSVKESVNKEAVNNGNEFEAMQALIEEILGVLIPPKKEEIDAINEMVVLEIVADDIRSAVGFFESKGRVARGAAHILDSVKYSRSQRIQRDRKKKPERQRGAPSKSEIERLKQLKEKERSSANGCD